MKRWEELVGEIQSVTQSEEIIKVTLSIISLLSLKLPKNKISGDLPQLGKRASVLRTDNEYRIRSYPVESVFTSRYPRILELSPHADYKIVD